jgi:hypothetical protein
MERALHLRRYVGEACARLIVATGVHLRSELGDVGGDGLGLPRGSDPAIGEAT